MKSTAVWIATVGLLVLVALTFCQPDTSLLLMVFVVAPALVVMSIAWPIYVAARDRRQLPRVALTLGMLWAMSAAVFLYNRNHPFALWEAARWSAWSHQYKKEVLAQPSSSNGNLKHIEWDGTGFAGVANNTVYLVFGTRSGTTANLKGGTANGKGRIARRGFEPVFRELSSALRYASLWLQLQVAIAIPRLTDETP
jgi:hypothetical protein